MNLFHKYILTLSSVLIVAIFSFSSSLIVQLADASNGRCSATAHPSFVQPNTQTPITVTVTNNEDYYIGDVQFLGGNSTTLDVVDSLSGWSIGRTGYLYDTFAAASAYPGI